MKRTDAVLRSLGDAVPVACGMIACVCAVTTAYQIGFAKTPLILFCVFSALLLSFWMNIPKYGFGFGALFLTCVIVLFVFRMKRIGDGATAFAYRLLTELPKGISGLFDLEALEEAAAPIREPDMCISLFLMLVAAFFGFMLAFSLIRSRMALLPLLIPLPMLLVSLVYTNRPPALWTMVLLTVYFGCALLGNGLRKGDSATRGLFAAVLPPALLALALLVIAAFPQSSFVPISAEKRQAIFSERFGSIADTMMSWFGTKSPHAFRLSDEGERKEDDTEMFTVYARSGTYLLRTHSYGAYKNNRWQSADAYRGEWNSMAALGMRQEKTDATMWICGSVSGERVAPYAWTDEPVSTDSEEQPSRPAADESSVPAGGWRDYAWRYKSRFAIDAGRVTEEERAYYESFALKQYTMPDGAQKEALLDILKAAGITRGPDTLETAKTVAAFVRDSAEYTLTPGDVPKGKDFVRYFLTENRKGYCVHFASATTALLQALGCPARYTIGYYAEIPVEMSGEGVTVTKNDEHAWTEVYLLGVGWVPIESTPGRYGSGNTETGDPIGGQTTTAPTPVPTPTTTAVPSAAPQETPASTPQTTTVPNVSAPTAAPQTGKAGSQQIGAQSTKTRAGAWWILIPLIPLLWVAAGSLIRRMRDLRFRDANVRRSIPDMAQYLRRLERFGAEKDPDAEEWATEAAFSNHKMKAEHRTLLKRVHTVQQTLYADKPVLRFLLRWVLYLI